MGKREGTKGRREMEEQEERRRRRNTASHVTRAHQSGIKWTKKKR